MSKTQIMLDIISKLDIGSGIKIIGEPQQSYQIYKPKTKNRNNYLAHHFPSLLRHTGRITIMDSLLPYVSGCSEKELQQKLDKDLGKGYNKPPTPPNFDNFIKADEFRNRGEKKVYNPPPQQKIKKSKKEKEQEPTLEEKIHQFYIDIENERKKEIGEIFVKNLQEYMDAKELAEHIAYQESLNKRDNLGKNYYNSGQFKPSKPTIGSANIPGGGTFQYSPMKKIVVTKGLQTVPIKGVKKI